MEFLEQIAKIGALLGAVGAIVAALIGTVSWSRFTRRTLTGLVFMKYTERYEQVMAAFPPGVSATRIDSSGQIPELTEELKLSLLRYFNLCSEEFSLWKKKYLENDIWKMWEAELQRTLSTPLYRRAWQVLRKEFESYPDFCKYVDAIHKKMDENLQRWSASREPSDWVGQRKGSWDHAEWYALLDKLQESAYWPMDPHEVGQVLEAKKAEYLKKAEGS